MNDATGVRLFTRNGHARGSTAVIEPTALANVTIIPAGTLDETSWLNPAMEIYCDDAQSWVQLGGGMQRFPKMHHQKG